MCVDFLSKRFLGTVLFFLCAVAAFSGPAEAAYESQPRYNIKAEFNPQSKTISAAEEVQFTNTGNDPVSSLYFHIYPNRVYTKKEQETYLRYSAFFKANPFPEGFQSALFSIQSVSQVRVTKQLLYQLEGEDKTLLRVDLGAPLAPGESVQVKIDFSVKLPHAYGRLGWHNNVFVLSRWYPILSVRNEKGWANYPFYPFHRPFFSEASFYRVDLTVPQGQVVIHSGQLENEQADSGGRKILTIDSVNPIREFTMAMSPDYQALEKKWEGITLRSFYLPGGKEHAQLALDNAADMFAFYTETFGPYPYGTFNIAPVYLGYGGEQMSNVMFLDSRAYQLPRALDRYFDFLSAHEAGHQWLYNIIGIDEYKEIWLEEGVHSYFIGKYIEKKYGADAEVVEFPRWAKPLKWFLPKFTFKGARETRYQMLARIGLDHPVVSELSSFQEPSSIFAVTYGKGSRIVAMLEDILGKDVFASVFKRIFNEYQFRNLSVDDFVRICQEESGKDLAWFFDEWLYKEGHLDAIVTGVRKNKVTLKEEGGMVMPVEVKADFADGSSKTVVWEGPDKNNEVCFAEGAKIKNVRLDPEKKLLELDRSNNSWPQAYNVKVVPLYHGLYDVPALLPDDGYNIILGPEISNGGLGVKASSQKPYDQNFYAATDWDFSEHLQYSRAGYQLSNLLGTQLAAGLEISNRKDNDNGDEDLTSGKIYLRKELWPVPYGFTNINDHITLYLIRNRGLGTTLITGGQEDTRNISYLKSNEAIAGLNFHFERSYPYPDPSKGYRVDALAESSGHFWGATQYFYRTALDTSFYQPVTKRSKAALRLKYGWGQPKDKNLFQLGGWDGLRGYDRKEIRGSNSLLSSVEYRFPLKENIRAGFLDNIFILNSINGVVFFDAGQGWFNDFDDSSLKKDAGVGLRAVVDVGSYFEKVVLRADIAQAINDASEDDTKFWFGINHAF